MNATQINQLILGRLRPLLLCFGLWAGLVTLFATQFAIVGSLSWLDSFTLAASFWMLWAFFLPAVVWISFRFPLERKRVVINVGAHLTACILVVAASQAASRFLPMPGPPNRVGAPRPGGERGSVPQPQPPQPPQRPPQRPPPDRGGSRPNGFAGMRAALDMLIYWAIVSVCQAIANSRRSQQRERRAIELEARLAHAKLHALRMQINPHFLFNTLNAISTLVHTNPKAADEMIGDLSELFRSSLDSTDELEVPLGRELEFLRCYLDIEQRRFGDRLRVELTVPQDMMTALVPTLILQPIVENAVRHGIEPQSGPGMITISAHREGENLQLTVSDNGPGPVLLPTGRGVKPGGYGIGLTNTRARLQELYGDNQQFSFGPGLAGGCLVVIRIPFHTDLVKPAATVDAAS